MCICDSMIFYVYITCFYNYQYFDVGGTRWTGCRDMSRLCSSQSSVSERRRPPKRICLGECEATAKWQCTTCHFQVSTVPMHQIEYINLVETSNLWESCRLVSFVCHYFRFILSLGTYSTQLRAQELFVEVASNLTSVQDCQVRNRMQCGSARHSAGYFAGCCAEKNLSNDFVTPTCQVLIWVGWQRHWCIAASLSEQFLPS
jgi:hypothetical protein